MGRYLGLHINGIWIQEDDFRFWFTRFLPGINIDGPINLAWGGGQHTNLLLVYIDLIPPIINRFWINFKGLIIWKSTVKTILIIPWDWWNCQETILNVTCGGVTNSSWMVGVIKNARSVTFIFIKAANGGNTDCL